MSIENRFRTSLVTSLFFLAAVSVVQAQYSGGSGMAEDPYQIATAADLIALGETPDDYDKHFILTADIDLDPNLPGGRVFDRAVIAPDVSDVPDQWGHNYFDGSWFTGVFDGDGHTVSHLAITGVSYLGLFGTLSSQARVSNLCLEMVNVEGSGSCIGGLAGTNKGQMTDSYVTGAVSGDSYVGGLVGTNDEL